MLFIFYKFLKILKLVTNSDKILLGRVFFERIINNLCYIVWLANDNNHLKKVSLICQLRKIMKE